MAQGTYKLTDTLSITGGFRYTSDKSSGLGQAMKITLPAPNTPSYGCTQPLPLVQGGTSAQVQSNPALCDFRRSVKSSEPTWPIDLDLKPVEDVLFYAKCARGYRQGGINVSSYGLEVWDPERVDLYELGAKTSFSGFVRGTFNIAAFCNDLSNHQIAINTVSCTSLPPAILPFVPARVDIPSSQFPAPAQGIGNGGKSTIKGVEVDATITPFEGFNINVGYAHLATKLKSIVVPPIQRGFAVFTPNAIVGGPLSLTPMNKYTISASYALPLDESVGRISVSATFIHQDSMFGNASSIVVGSATNSDHDGEFLPPQNLLNLNINWRSVAGAPIDISLFATNVTTEKFQVYTTGASFGWDAYTLNEPRMFLARVNIVSAADLI